MAMAAPAKDSEFKGNVEAVFTEESLDKLQDLALEKRGQVNREMKELEKEKGKLDRSEREKIYNEKLTKLLSKKELAALDGVSNQGFHYHGSGKILGGIGKQFAEAMLSMMK
jgi:hypothetical protein